MRARFASTGWFGSALLALACVSCSSVQRVETPVGFADAPPAYSLVFIIHGDGGYIFYDANGTAHRADEAILARARTVAERNPNAEVFLFHETPRKHVLLLFPRKDGHAYYYRNGRLVAERSYWRDDGDSRFDPELAIYDALSATRAKETTRMFFYFGHEVPEFVGIGYDASYPDRPFTVYDLARGVAGIADAGQKVDLVVLGTCFGGTPHTINALAPCARFVVASPENVHRSYFDLRPLENLGTQPTDMSVFAEHFARNAFETLTANVQTAVSVAVYEADSVRTFTGEVEGSYQRALSGLDARSRAEVGRCDCADDSSFALPELRDGVTVFYRAARFGRAKSKGSHSGWSCWKAKS